MKSFFAAASSNRIVRGVAALIGIIALAITGEVVYQHGGSAVASLTESSPVAPEKVSAGDQAKVEFVIQGGYTKPEWKHSLINSKADYKASDNLTLFIPKGMGFDDPKSLVGRTVIVTGKVEDYKGTKEIKVTDAKQLTLKP